MKQEPLRRWASAVWREPVAIFFLIAAGVMLAGVDARPPSRTRITISEEAVASTRERLITTLKREPNTEELRAAIDSVVNGEVLYREALRLGLDRRDPIVRRRLIQKMEMVLEQSAGSYAGSEEELRAWYEENLDLFVAPEQRSFSQMQLGEVSDDELGLLETRANELGLEADVVGDEIARQPSAHSRAQRGMSEAETARRFGAGVAREVFSGSEGVWHAVRGAHGWMLVRVDSIQGAGPTEFTKVRGQVRELRAAALRETMRVKKIINLRQRYEVEVER